MSALDRPDLVPVPVGYCPCEGTPHPDGDIVYLYPELPAPAGVKARSFFNDGMMSTIDKATIEERIAELWLSMCVAEWTFLFDDGKPIPVTPENVLRALPYAKGGRLVADKADDLYVDSVTGPLLTGLETLLRPGPVRRGRPGTSQRKPSQPKPRPRSSTATSAKALPPG